MITKTAAQIIVGDAIMLRNGFTTVIITRVEPAFDPANVALIWVWQDQERLGLYSIDEEITCLDAPIL